MIKKDCIKDEEKNMNMGELCNHWTLKKEKRDGVRRETAINTTAEDSAEHLSSTDLPETGI